MASSKQGSLSTYAPQSMGNKLESHTLSVLILLLLCQLPHSHTIDRLISNFVCDIIHLGHCKRIWLLSVFSFLLLFYICNFSHYGIIEEIICHKISAATIQIDFKCGMLLYTDRGICCKGFWLISSIFLYN